MRYWFVVVLVLVGCGHKPTVPDQLTTYYTDTDIPFSGPCENGSGSGSDYLIFKCSGGKWVEDKELETKMQEDCSKQEKARTELLWAARTRILDVDEMKYLENAGVHVFERYCQDGWVVISENEDSQHSRMLNDLLLQQFKMRIFAEERGRNK